MRNRTYICSANALICYHLSAGLRIQSKGENYFKNNNSPQKESFSLTTAKQDLTTVFILSQECDL